MTADNLWFVKEDGSAEQFNQIGEQRVVKTEINGNVRVHITADGNIHWPGDCFYGKMVNSQAADELSD